MSLDRRTFVATAASIAAFPPNARAAISKDATMYGLISKITAQPGSRDKLVNVLLDGVGATGLLGCLSYIVAIDSSSPDVIWVTETWKNKQAHTASLALPSVQTAMNAGQPLIAGFSRVAETAPLDRSRLPA
jgi:quinol monooxygenase YgiN